MIKAKFWCAFTSVFLLSIAVQAGVVRTVYVNNEKMTPVYYSLGKSSILRFTERPKKVVVGNKNYFEIEFVGNDVTIQPLGQARTNIFVYTEYHVYGFLLRPTSSGYDDLVNVKWKSRGVSFRKRPKPAPPKSIFFRPIELNIKDQLQVLISGISKSQINPDVYFIDVSLKNKGDKEINTGELSIFATRNNKKITNQSVIFKTDKIKKNEYSSARMFITLKVKKGFSLNVKLRDKSVKAIISRKYL